MYFILKVQFSYPSINLAASGIFVSPSVPYILTFRARSLYAVQGLKYQRSHNIIVSKQTS